MATRGQVLDRVAALLEDATSTTRTRLEPWVDFVLMECKQAGIIGPEVTTTTATVAGTATYNVATDVDVITSVYLQDDTGEPLHYISPAQMDAHLADDDDYTGIPEEYTVYPRNAGDTTPVIRLWPIPNSVESLIIRYESDFTALAADATVLKIPADVFTTIVWGVYRIWTRIEENDDIGSVTAEFQESLRRAKFKQVGTLNRVFRTKYNDA